MLETYFTKKPEFEIVPMQSEDCFAVSTLHGERFPRPWNDGEFHGLLTQPHVFGFVARQTSGFFRSPLPGFVLAREAGGEAEILTIAVQAKLARSGLGWRLMQAALREADQRGGEKVFLEVESGNAAAIGFYRKLGFEKIAERPAYYSDKNGVRSTALVMRRDLR